MKSHLVLTVALSACGVANVERESVESSLTSASKPSGCPQFIAKLYSEALGRIPDQIGWQAQMDWFAQYGCSKANLQLQGAGILASQEFTDLGYDGQAKVLIAYRTILNREPDGGGFAYYAGLVKDDPSQFPTVVKTLFSSAEFDTLAKQITSSATSYGFGGPAYPAISLPVSGPNIGNESGATLQAQLNRAPAGSTIYLEQKAVIRVSSPITVPAGVTMRTYGAPDPQHHALMARIVRANDFAGATLTLSSGSVLQNIWIDGQRGVLPYSYDHVSVEMVGGAGTSVRDNFFTNTAGWTNVHSYGSLDRAACAKFYVGGNVLTDYSSNHSDGTWSDGISMGCEDTLVENNQIVDATDVGIVVFHADPAVQHSVVRNNRVLSAGNSAFGGLVFDPLFDDSVTPPSGYLSDFSGAVMIDNMLWTSPNTHFEVGLSAGTRDWFGSASYIGTGASFIDNTTGVLGMNVSMGIAVAGMMNVAISGNTLKLNLQNVSNGGCPLTPFVVEKSTGFASGSFGTVNALDLDIDGCI